MQPTHRPVWAVNRRPDFVRGDTRPRLSAYTLVSEKARPSRGMGQGESANRTLLSDDGKACIRNITVRNAFVVQCMERELNAARRSPSSDVRHT